MAAVGRKVDVDDILDTIDVAGLLGLTSRTAVSVYRSRYANFPKPLIEKGRCLMWLRQDVEKWVKSRGAS